MHIGAKNNSKTHPNIPEPIPLLQTQVWVPRAAITLNFTCPIAPADWLKFFRTENKSN